MDQIITLLENIVDKLDIIIENQKYKGLGNTNGPFGLIPCVSKDEIPLPTPWNSDNKPTCNGDILYKEPENPNWYKIQDAKI
jgi:hypothetical protein